MTEKRPKVLPDINLCFIIKFVILVYRESEIIELKQELNKNIKKEIVAFANSKGGTIYIGLTMMVMLLD